jgi:hypothetical protein
MALRLRYEVDNPGRLAKHLHLVDGAGYFFFPDEVSAEGTPAVLQVMFTDADGSAILRGKVWARPASGGVWLELAGAARCLAMLTPAPRESRFATEQLVLAEGAGQPALLCRLRDASEGGARLTASAADLGTPGVQVRVALPVAGLLGGQLEAFGRLAWAGEGDAGVEWNRGDLASRAAVRRVLELAAEEWEGTRSVAHPRSCRCMRKVALPEVLLLG